MKFRVQQEVRIMLDKIRKYLRERDIHIKPHTSFDEEPCFRCQEFDPCIILLPAKEPFCDVSSPFYDPDRYQQEEHPCDHRRNFCHTWNPICKHFKEAGHDFWSSEKWRIDNKPEYHYMNHNLWRNYQSFDTSARKQE